MRLARGSPAEVWARNLMLPLYVPWSPRNKRRNRASPLLDDPGGIAPWSDKSIVDFVDSFLFFNIEMLLDERTSQETMDDIKRWVEEPIPMVFRPQRIEYLSFFACCILCGIDPVKKQEEVLSKYEFFQRKKALKQELRNIKVLR